MRMRSDVLVANKRNALLVSVSFSIALLMVRIIHTGTLNTLFSYGTFSWPLCLF